MQDRPTIHELLDGVQRFLDQEIVPATEGRRQFLARVAANTIRLVDRELGLAEDHQAREWVRLDELLGPEPRPAGSEALCAALLRRNAALCERIRAGEADRPGQRRDQIFGHLRQIVRDKLSVTNPAYLRETATS